jgi:hypothetical protein
MARTRARTHAGAPVKASVTLPADIHLRLKLLAAMRRTTATEIIADLVEREVASVRLPSVSGLAGGNEESAPRPAG